MCRLPHATFRSLFSRHFNTLVLLQGRFGPALAKALEDRHTTVQMTQPLVRTHVSLDKISRKVTSLRTLDCTVSLLRTLWTDGFSRIDTSSEGVVDQP